MLTINNVHEQFASFFGSEKLKPFAFFVSKQLSEGHICLDLREIITGKIEFPIDYHQLEDIEKDLLAERLVGTSFEDRQPFILHNSRFYIQRYFVYETLILRRIKEFLKKEDASFFERKQQLLTKRDFLDELFINDDSIAHLPAEERIDWQFIASTLAVLNNFMIITGGPGTGKTTTTSKLLKILKAFDPNLKVALAAPTGKAAARLSESLEGEEATTIHRLLKSKANTHHFYHDAQNPLQFDVVIIDEASMIDVALFAKLLIAIGDDTRLILLGDKDQLASVGAGSLFRDLCLTQIRLNHLNTSMVDFINALIQQPERSLPEAYKNNINNTLLTNHIIELKRSRRFDSTKGIGKFSKAVINNEINLISSFISQGDSEQVCIDTEYSDHVFNQCIDRYLDFLEEPDIKCALNKFNRFRVLCAIREGEQGLSHINKRIEDALIRRGHIHPNGEFYHNQPIIITRNYYDLGLYNGDIGIVRYDNDNELVAYFNDKNTVKKVVPGLIRHSETAFAMTIHKSQGSEYEEILVILPQKDDLNLLTRELLYTAITRAKKRVTLQSSGVGLFNIAERRVKRTSGISERFK